jgi:hypothetical protein
MSICVRRSSLPLQIAADSFVLTSMAVGADGSAHHTLMMAYKAGPMLFVSAV